MKLIKKILNSVNNGKKCIQTYTNLPKSLIILQSQRLNLKSRVKFFITKEPITKKRKFRNLAEEYLIPKSNSELDFFIWQL